MASSKMEVLRLFRQLLRESKKFPDYMYRTYALRRIADAFKDHKMETDTQKIKDLMINGKESLELIKRQVIVGQLYRGQETVIEKKLQESSKTY